MSAQNRHQREILAMDSQIKLRKRKYKELKSDYEAILNENAALKRQIKRM